MSSDSGAEDHLRRLARRLNSVADDLAGETRQAELRAIRSELDAIVTELRVLVLRRFGRKPKAAAGAGATQAILAHLQAHVGDWVDGQELAAVSGIGEWARRVRELRVEEGYDIPERGGRYRLLDLEPNAAAAARWRTMNTIRKMKDISATARIKAFLTVYVGEVVTRDDIDYVGGIKEAIRRARELRDEEGWPFESHIEDRQLRPGEYRLVSVEEADLMDSRQRRYPENLRARVFKRDGYTCQQCGRDRTKAEMAGDKRFYLEVHHHNAVAEQLDALSTEQLHDESNLQTLCHGCHVLETAEFQKRRRQERRGQPIQHADDHSGDGPDRG